jgi:hypothetical protein
MRGIPAGEQTVTFSGFWNTGIVNLGGTKAVVERCVARFDVMSAAYIGRALTPADVITAAQLVLAISNIPGDAGFACELDRITRPAWDYLTADWIEWATGQNWTATGGDVSGAPLADAAPSDAGLADYAIDGLDALVIDAIANRAGALILRSRATSEADDDHTRHYSALGTGADPTQQPRLVVTYEGQEPAPVDLPDLRTMRGSTAGRAAATSPAAAPASTARPARGASKHGR